jgi:hypothetical protein
MRSTLLRSLLAVGPVAFLAVAALPAEAQYYSVFVNGNYAEVEVPPVEFLNIQVTGGVGSWGVASARSGRGHLEAESYCENPISGLWTPQVQSGGYCSFDAFDLFLDGPAGVVPVTFHLVLDGTLSISGMYPYGASVRVMGFVPGASDFYGGMAWVDGSGFHADGVLAGITSPGDVSYQFDVTGSMNAGTKGDFFYLLMEIGTGGTAVGLDRNTATADFMSGGSGGMGGLRFPTSGPAVTVPPGYSLSCEDLGIVDNYWIPGATTSVDGPESSESTWGNLKRLYR